jgi:photosystem II stability/assembly factor-like uncharacterized protein
MKKTKLLILIIFCFSLSLVLSGCVTIQTDSSTNTNRLDGGVFKTVDRGTLWQQKVLIPTTTGRPGYIAALDAASMVMDPGDENTIYFGSVGAGLFYTNNQGDSWNQVGLLGDSTIRAIAVDPYNKCTIYVSIGNKVYKTTDCSRTWSPVYVDNEVTATVDAITIDQYNNANVYIGISRGDIDKTTDYGDSWQNIYRTKDKIKKIIFDQNNSKVLYVLTKDNGVYRTTDEGVNWTQINDQLNQAKIGNAVNELISIKGQSGLIYVATEQGLAYSKDLGETWQKIQIITPQDKSSINDMVMNYGDTKEIYYVTNTTFYRSIDGGASWTTIKLPTSRAGNILVLDPKTPNIIYLGLKTISNQ